LIADEDRTVAEKDSGPELFTPDSNPFGVAYREWTIRWWRWCLSQPKSTNPVNDLKRTDRNAGNNQIYSDVWFLAGTTGGYAERECTIPKSKAIICPIINYEISTAENPDLVTDEKLVTFAREDVNKIARVEVVIDGTRIPDSKKFRIESGPFDIVLPENNIWGVKAGPTRAAADGYWMFLKPLGEGDHTIQFGGSCLAGTVNIGTTYHIRII
jgi:hypothetical protein